MMDIVATIAAMSNAQIVHYLEESPPLTDDERTAVDASVRAYHRAYPHTMFILAVLERL